MNFTTQAELSDLILQAQQGRFPDRLFFVLSHMVERLGGNDDTLQDSAVSLLRNLHRLQVDRNLFAYFTTMIIGQMKYRARQERDDRKKNRRWAESRGWVAQWKSEGRFRWRFNRRGALFAYRS